MGANSSSSSYPTLASGGGGGGGGGGGSVVNSNSSNNPNGNVSGVVLPMSMAGMSTAGAVAMTTGSGSLGGTPGIVISGGAGGAAQHYHHRDQRRKRATGFATLKRKFIRRRRSSKACDHARVLRDFVSDWAPIELAALCEEFEALSALRDLSVSKNYTFTSINTVFNESSLFKIL